MSKRILQVGVAVLALLLAAALFLFHPSRLNGETVRVVARISAVW